MATLKQLKEKLDNAIFNDGDEIEHVDLSYKQFNKLIDEIISAALEEGANLNDRPKH